MGDGKHRQLNPEVYEVDRAEYWRRLAELAGVAEGPGGAAEGGDSGPGTVNRRAWLQRVAASMALAGVAGCSRQRGAKILPYNINPPHATPGIPRYYATTFVLDGFATGVLAESHDGRPTKIEGNPDHPASLGATNVFDQAAVLGLYDPDRAQATRAPRAVSSWEVFFTQFARDRADQGEGLRFLMEPTGSPLLADLLGRVRTRFPRAKFTFYAPTRAGNGEAGAKTAFGTPAQPQFDFTKADVILALDDDFLSMAPFSVRYSRDFAARRRPSSPEASMNRLYVVETMFTATGSIADHRLRRRPTEIGPFAANVALALLDERRGRGGGVPQALAAALARFRSDQDDHAARAIARDLLRHPGAGVVTVGEGQPASVHALAHAMNSLLGDADRTTWAIAPTLVGLGDAEQDLAALAAELGAGTIDTLVVLETNPVYSAPADLDFATKMGKVRDVVQLSLYEDESAAIAKWFLPAAHVLESWGDATAWDGTASLIQPLIQPLYGGRTPAEVLAVFAGMDHPEPLAMLRALWAKRSSASDFDDFWARTLTRGVVAGSAASRLRAEVDMDRVAAAVAKLPPPSPAGALELSFAPDPATYDGRFANNPWLLEFPKPVTKLTWDNAAMMSPKTAEHLGLSGGDVVEIESNGRTLRAPAFVLPGHADDAVTLHLGYGRKGSLALAFGVGFSAYALRTTASPSHAGPAHVHRVAGETHVLARSQVHFDTHDRPIALHATLAEYESHPAFTAEQKGPLPNLMPPWEQAGEQWAMTIDMSICTGCSACVVACQAENNVLVVGKEDVSNSRIMQWLRIDNYFDGTAEDPRVTNQPMLCQHCELAPCEYVCPVNATVHSSDGLNEMIYNRCVGTRFCSNNCPYKVRRFNWFDYNMAEHANAGLVQLQRNPDVTVRQRGVMEKCTYCVQRIREVEIHARNEDRAIRPGEVVTACAQACPTGAIKFGSLTHPDTDMVRWRNEPRSFAVLHELGTRPRTMYLARIQNPNPEMG